jgi:acetyl-CoA carboxylase biotin carboxyl carrier protein
MTFSAEDIGTIAGWLADSGLAGLELAGPGVSLRLTRSADGQVVEVTDHETAAVASDAGGDLVVRSPIAGTFLTAHPMRVAPLLEPGGPVAEGQTIGLVAVGPLLVPVIAPRSGSATAVMGVDGGLVGYGDPLAGLHCA